MTYPQGLETFVALQLKTLPLKKNDFQTENTPALPSASPR